jgi:hypothetical protein
MIIAKLIPFYKSEDKTKSRYYRPISPLSNIYKILEKKFVSTLIIFLECNTLHANFPGFCKNHNTSVLLDTFYKLNLQGPHNKEQTMAIFCDLRKAFEAVDHFILTKQSGLRGMCGTELKWFKNYLWDQKQLF